MVYVDEVDYVPLAAGGLGQRCCPAWERWSASPSSAFTYQEGQVMDRFDEQFGPWGVFVAPAMPRLRWLAAVYLPVSDREDLIQDALIRAWSKRATFDHTRGSASVWISAILVDLVRKRKRAPRAPTLFNAIDTDSKLGDPSSTAAVDVRRAVAGLPRRQREVAVLFYYVDLSVQDISRLIGCSEGTVKSSLYDARTRLSGELSNYEHR